MFGVVNGSASAVEIPTCAAQFASSEECGCRNQATRCVPNRVLESLALDESEAMFLVVLGSQLAGSQLRARLAAALAFTWSMGASEIERLDGLGLFASSACLHVHQSPRD